MHPYNDSTVTSPSTESAQAVCTSDQGTIYLTVLIDTYNKAHRDLHWKLRYIFQECSDIAALSERYYVVFIAFSENRRRVA